MRHIDNFFTKEECEWFLWYDTVLPETRDNGLRYQTMCHFAQPFFAHKLQQLQAKLPANEEITTVNINHDYAAGGIHSDGYLDHDKDDDIANSYLIPIKYTYEEPYYTLVFKQSSDRAITFNAETGLGSKGITTYKQTTREEYGLDDTPFDKTDYGLLTHLDYDKLAGFTVDRIHCWSLGTAMTWPRKRFHVSADFSGKYPRSSVLILTRFK
mgnify:CR=1 FL=1